MSLGEKAKRSIERGMKLGRWTPERTVISADVGVQWDDSRHKANP